MRKALSFYNIAHQYGTGLLIPTYVVLGIGLIPTSTLMAEMRHVQNVVFRECHKSCHVAKGKEYCTTVCSGNTNTDKTINGRPSKKQSCTTAHVQLYSRSVGTQGCHKH